MKRYEVSATQFAAIADLFPANGRRGGQWNDHRRTLDAVPWVLPTGAQWREPPGRYGSWKTAHSRPTRWRRGGTLGRVLGRRHLRLDERGLIDHDLWCVDATHARAGRSAAGGKNRPRRTARPRPGPQPGRAPDRAAPGDGRRPGAAGGAGDGRAGPRVGPPGAGAGQAARPGAAPRPAGDKGYPRPRIRRRRRGRGIRAVIPRRSDQRPGDGRVWLDRAAYRRRGVAERRVGWLRESRRPATRHEKLAVNFEAMAVLAAIRLCLRKLDSPDRTSAGLALGCVLTGTCSATWCRTGRWVWSGTTRWTATPARR